MPLSRKRFIIRLIEEFPGLQASVKFKCEALKVDAVTSEAVWRVSREVTLSPNRIQTTVAPGPLFGQICDDREALFPPLPFINTISTLFDGNDDECRTGLDPTNLQFERTSPFSTSFLIKTGIPGVVQTIIDKQKSTANFRGWGITIVASKIRFILRSSTIGPNALVVDGNLPISADTWEHWVVTYDGGSLPASVNFYQDGAINPAPVTIDDSLTATTISDERFRIGRRSGPSIPFDGNIDQVTIWNKELTSLEAAEASTIDRGKNDILSHSATANIISHWRMGDELTFPLTVDQKGTDDLTLINGVDQATSFVTDVAP